MLTLCSNVIMNINEDLAIFWKDKGIFFYGCYRVNCTLIVLVMVHFNKEYNLVFSIFVTFNVFCNICSILKICNWNICCTFEMLVYNFVNKISCSVIKINNYSQPCKNRQLIAEDNSSQLEFHKMVLQL